jgi:hypothetical protein
LAKSVFRPISVLPKREFVRVKEKRGMTMTLKAEFKGHDTIIFNGEEFKGRSPVCTLSRVLKERGMSDDTIEIYRGEMKCLIVKSFYVMADKRIRETSSGERYAKRDPLALKG